jgi:hypothetical protein
MDAIGALENIGGVGAVRTLILFLRRHADKKADMPTTPIYTAARALEHLTGIAPNLVYDYGGARYVSKAALRRDVATWQKWLDGHK